MPAPPRSVLDTNDLPAPHRYAAWRESFSVGFGYELHPDVAPGRFRARIENTLFDQIMLTHFQASAASYERSAARIARDGVDLVMLQLYLAGPVRYRRNGQTHGCRVGDLVLMDLAQTLDSWHDEQHNLTLCIPRRMLADALPAFEDAHLGVLAAEHPVNHLLRSHMLTLQRSAALFSSEAIPAVAQSTLALATAAASAIMGVGQLDPAPLQRALRTRADEVVLALLGEPDLTPERVALAVPCSRSRLYALYADEGGVAAYIQQCRLRAVLHDLVTGRHRRQHIGLIAERWGFANIPSFNRAFKAAFGCTPSEARGRGVAMGPYKRRQSGIRPDNPHAYEVWVREVLSSE